jgi:hypothetical protein
MQGASSTPLWPSLQSRRCYLGNRPCRPDPYLAWNVKFDLPRQMKKNEWARVKGKIQQTSAVPWPNKPDLANDSAIQNGISVPPLHDHIYSIDAPGYKFATAPAGFDVSEIIQSKLFYEFVRVSFDGNAPKGNTDQGSRCSDKSPWHMFMWLELNGVNYIAKANKKNEVDLGHPAPPDPTH